MKNFYKSNGLKNKNIQLWSDKLNEYKKDKNYSLIEQSIKEYMTVYAIEIMKYDKFSDCFHSSILATNIKRWNKISNKFHFENLEKNKQIFILFEAFNCIKCKMDEKLYPILELFVDLNAMILSDFSYLIVLSLELGQGKMLDCISKILGYKKLAQLINEQCPEFLNNEIRIIGHKLCKKYKNYIKN